MQKLSLAGDAEHARHDVVRAVSPRSMEMTAPNDHDCPAVRRGCLRQGSDKGSRSPRAGARTGFDTKRRQRICSAGLP
jgi:hypothetical protein